MDRIDRMDKEKKAMQKTKDKRDLRRTVALPWIFLIVIAVHAFAVLGPEVVRDGAENMTPEAQIHAARVLEREERYDEALELYAAALRRKPEVPPIWQEAEREVQQVRIKAEQQRRKLADPEKEEEHGDEAQKIASSPDPAAVTPAVQSRPPTPAVQLPQLPDIGDF